MELFALALIKATSQQLYQNAPLSLRKGPGARPTKRNGPAPLEESRPVR